ncbi:hypothetical protein [Peribacillus simplex]|uniref:Uncharacterized protein n=1 Tax=Peribacillus simplex TaxID=1478 RepID=A0AAW7I952_9BACI|nr:hypothetical protein [Peribacillus simplex]MDM5451804.1 hypothetical protein [Peribacillus simplex]
MKRYICSIIIGMVVILSIGTYYVKVASSASGLPKYNFKTLEGSDKELDPVIIHGSLEVNPIYEPLTIESNQSIYASERSYFENLSGIRDFQIERLIKEHRSFMRGRDSINSLYEDDDFLAYASVNEDFTKNGKMEAEFDIGLLEKKGEDETSFKIELPDHERIMNVVVRDVQLVHSKLQVLTMNDVNSNDEKQTIEVHLYTIDLANKKVLSDKTLLSETFTDPNQVDLEMPTDIVPSQPNNMVLISLIKGVNHEDGFKEKLKESKLLSYNYDTEKLETVKLPKKESLSPDMARGGYADGKKLYIVDTKSDKYHIKTFDLSSQKITNDMELDLTVNKKEQNFAAFKNGRVYFLSGSGRDQEGVLTSKPAQLLITDYKTGKTLYKGETVTNKKNGKNYGFNIESLEVK